MRDERESRRWSRWGTTFLQSGPCRTDVSTRRSGGCAVSISLLQLIDLDSMGLA